jgi:hypothetical protein
MMGKVKSCQSEVWTWVPLGSEPRITVLVRARINSGVSQSLCLIVHRFMMKNEIIVVYGSYFSKYIMHENEFQKLKGRDQFVRISMDWIILYDRKCMY